MSYLLLVFLLGSAIGSFVNVLIDRSVKQQDWVKGRSRCDHCHKVLSWYEMVPILSFVVYRGKARCCGYPLPYRYPIVESLTGVLFGWWFLMGFFFFQLVSSPWHVIQPSFWLLSGVILLILLLADWLYGVVLMQVVWFGTALTLIYRVSLTVYGFYQASDLVNALILSFLAYGIFWLLYKLTKGRGMAEGDMYVAMYLGLLLGWPKGAMAIMLSFILGAVVGVGLIATGYKTRKDTLPFVPFMVVASILVLLRYGEIINFLG